MLGTKDRNKIKPEGNLAPRTTSMKEGTNCIVAKGTKIEGNFKSSENVRLDGVIVGELRCDKKVVMGENGRIEGKLIAGDAFIKGTVDGEVAIMGTLHLQATAVINGDIAAKAITVEEGAQYNGNCKIGSGAIKKQIAV